MVSILFISCNQNPKFENTRSANPTTYKLDTILSNYKIVLTMPDSRILKGVSNKIHLDILNFDSKNIIIFTKTSEASVNIGENSGDFLVKPTPTTDFVTININLRKNNGQISEIGKLIIMTK